MLSLLHIENIALIDKADIQFNKGFNVLTGETGAGKSIVIDAINAVIGERTSRDLIRTGASTASVSAVFSDISSNKWLEELDVHPDEDGNLLLSRDILQDGRNVCKINGKLSTVAQLKQVGKQLINIHGQHDGQQLLDESYHLYYLDAFGENESLKETYAKKYQKLCEIRNKITKLEMDEQEKSRKIDSLNFQINEIRRAELNPDKDGELEERREILRNSGKIMDAVESAYISLYGDDDSDGALSLLLNVSRELNRIRNVGSMYGELADRIDQIQCEADDILDQLRYCRDDLSFSPEEQDEIESRLDVIYRLKRKYGDSIEEIISYCEKCEAELDEIQFSEEAIIRLKKQETDAYAEAMDAAKNLSIIRHEHALTLQDRIQKELKQLDMPRVTFVVDFSNTDLGPDGIDNVQFLMSANIGENIKPIQKVASGGELARIMLAMKNVLAEKDSIDTLIFDEVDTGVSGRAAHKVALKMASVAKKKQVLCVTHLPQIAAAASTHYRVEKGERDTRTYTEVSQLSFDNRVSELARLIGGESITDTILSSAKELISEYNI